MKPRERSPIPVLLLCALCLPAARPEEIAIPEQMKAVAARISVNSTPCSVTCGLGLQVEQVCEITPAGERRACSMLRSWCLSSWTCGLRHLSVPVGHSLQLSCLASEAATFGRQTYGFSWRVAPGLITTNDLLFQPLENTEPALSISQAKEEDAGTYRCDVEVLETFKIVQRIDFGLRVVPKKLVGLDFEKSLTLEQKLEANLQEGGAGEGKPEGQEGLWAQRLWAEAVLGAGSGVLGGTLVSLLLCCCLRAWKRRRAEE